MGHLEGEQLHSMLRYTLVLFPNTIALALLARRLWGRVLVSVLFVFFVLLQLALLAGFVRWIWIA
ncbi:MAG: hypothetical protein E3J64_03855 [Anaerolineales bacterium]|nr:MAG: hypothetical protein E3J64_03855 [Anaerolineales bacterium]